MKTAETITAVYLGVDRRGEPETVLSRAASFRWVFSAGAFPLSFPPEDPFRLPNLLKHGQSFVLTLRGGVITDLAPAEKEAPAPAFRNTFRGVPGVRTLKNFFQTALMPVGQALYVYGGGWNFQDTGSNAETRSLGLSPSWRRFFLSQSENYTYRDPFGDEKKADPATSFYPYGGFNEYGWAGLDCSGFVGWTLYNTLEAENGLPGYVGPSTKMAASLAARGLGSFSRPAAPLRPGDIVSLKGHVWISLGTCPDGSVLILHSTPSPSRAGQPGGGVQIGAVGESPSCEAYALARKSMERLCPEWFARYDAALKSPKDYFAFPEGGPGVFSWDTASALRDPDNLRSLAPSALLDFLGV